MTATIAITIKHKSVVAASPKGGHKRIHKGDDVKWFNDTRIKPDARGIQLQFTEFDYGGSATPVWLFGNIQPTPGIDFDKANGIVRIGPDLPFTAALDTIGCFEYTVSVLQAGSSNVDGNFEALDPIIIIDR